MAAKGTQAKEEIMSKLKEVFPDSFMSDKIFVIPWQENGETVHIKCAFTCAKALLTSNAAAAPTETSTLSNGMKGFPSVPQEPTAITEPTEEEKANMSLLLEKLGL